MSDYSPNSTFVLRTALLSAESMLSLSEGLGARSARADGGDLREMVARDRVLVHERLRRVFDDPVVREALFVASPSLTTALNAWIADESSPLGRTAVAPALRYFLRMSGRSVPFGLFAGCSVVRIADATNLELGPASHYRRHTRLDAGYLAACVRSLVGDPDILQQLRYRPNSTLAKMGDELRYHEVKVNPDTKEQIFEFVAAERTDFMEVVLRRARANDEGATVDSLMDAVRSLDLELSAEEARGFVIEMVSSQLLVPNVAPSFYGPEPLQGLLDAVAPVTAASAVLASLRNMKDALRSLDGTPLGVAPAAYEAIHQLSEGLGGTAEPGRFLHVDLYKPSPEATMGSRVLQELRRAVDVVVRVGRHTNGHSLEYFRREFLARFGHTEVPLLEALDQERGIPVPGEDCELELSPLIADLPFAATDWSASFDQHDAWLLRHVMECRQKREVEWVLEEADLGHFEGRERLPLPEAFALQARIESKSSEALRRGDVRVHVRGIVGPSGGCLLGRFCHGDPGIEEAVRAHLRAEELLRPEAIFAEVVHSPQGRAGNVVARPALRTHVIEYVGGTSGHSTTAITADDLMVSIDDEGRIRLRSVSLDREIVPRLTNAHNAGGAPLPVYRFLAFVQDQSWARWSWGALEHAPFLPRVRFKNVVLAPAQWWLSAGDLTPLVKAGSSEERFELSERMREALFLPRWVAIVEGDSLLPIDLDNTVLIDLWVDIARRKPNSSMLIQELAPAPELQAVHGPEGHYVHEIVVPFVRTERVVPPLSARRPARFVAAAKMPGTGALNLTVRCCGSVADRLLVEVVRPWVATATEQGDVDLWSFEREPADRGEIRIRAYGPESSLWTTAYPALVSRLQPWLDRGQVDAVGLQSSASAQARGHDPEVSSLAQWRKADSLAAIEALEVTTQGDRWVWCLRSLHRILSQLVPDVEERIAILSYLVSGGDGYVPPDTLVHAMGTRFRRDRELISQALNGEVPGNTGRVCDVAMIDVVDDVRQALNVMDASSRRAFVRRIMGEHVNRVIRSRHRRHRAMLFEYLVRACRSEKARGAQE